MKITCCPSVGDNHSHDHNKCHVSVEQFTKLQEQVIDLATVVQELSQDLQKVYDLVIKLTKVIYQEDNDD